MPRTVAEVFRLELLQDLPEPEDRALCALEPGRVPTDDELVLAFTAVLASRCFCGSERTGIAADAQWQRIRDALAKYRAEYILGILVSKFGSDLSNDVDPAELLDIKASCDILEDLVSCDAS